MHRQQFIAEYELCKRRGEGRVKQHKRRDEEVEGLESEIDRIEVLFHQ